MNPVRIYREWHRNYRFRSGFPALASGLAGSTRLRLRARFPAGTRDEGLDWITCSVIPGVTELWAQVLLAALSRSVGHPEPTIWVADCSGDLHLPRDARMRKVPLYNHHHGVKLDLLLRARSRSPWVVISDDDVFWTNIRPLAWALAEFDRRPKLAAVSLKPRTIRRPILAETVEQPMGSFCLVLRRQVWIDENLSFRFVDPHRKGDLDWCYDTADLAHVQLLDRGYEVAIAPKEIQADLASLDGVSTWALKLQKHDGEMQSVVTTDLRLRKAYRVFSCLEQLSRVDGQALVESAPLERALNWCTEHLDAEDRALIDTELEGLLSRIRRGVAPAGWPTSYRC